MDVLFLSVSTGGGHYKAADALKQTIEREYPGSGCLITDALKYINPVIDRLVVGSYLKALKSTPGVYGKLYDMSESDKYICRLTRKFNKLMSYKIEGLIEGFNPSVIVCTHTFPLQMLSNLKKRGRVHQPIIGIFTDYATHPFWLHDNVDAYVVAHDYIKQKMVEQGIPEQRIYPYGIPVANSFLNKKERLLALKSLGLEDKTTVLIMGGSLGFGEIYDTFTNLVGCKKDLQIIVIAGMNQRLKVQLERYPGNTGKSIRILGYTDQVADYMDAADILITKPGGMTVSEALVKKLPIFVISPIPGQEERNARFLINAGAAYRIPAGNKTGEFLSKVLDNPLILKEMREAACSIARPDSCKDITGLITELSENRAIVNQKIRLIPIRRIL